jgi:hypothetical protein
VTRYVGEGPVVNASRTGQSIRTEPVTGEHNPSVFVAPVRPG